MFIAHNPVPDSLVHQPWWWDATLEAWPCFSIKLMNMIPLLSSSYKWIVKNTMLTNQWKAIKTCILQDTCTNMQTFEDISIIFHICNYVSASPRKSQNMDFERSIDTSLLLHGIFIRIYGLFAEKKKISWFSLYCGKSHQWFHILDTNSGVAHTGINHQGLHYILVARLYFCWYFR